jgi:hypothetical protein
VSDEDLAQVRERLDAVEKENKKLQKDNAALIAENRNMKATSAIVEAGLSPDVAGLFIAANPETEITTDAVKEFAEKYGIQGKAVSTEGTEPTAPSPDDKGLQNFARAGSGAGGSGAAPADTKYLTTEEFIDLQKRDKVAAQKALAEGRIKLSNQNPYAQGAVPGSKNPFLAARQVASEGQS